MKSPETLHLETFVSKLKDSPNFQPDSSEIKKVCDLVTSSQDWMTPELQADVLRSISYFVLDNKIEQNTRDLCSDTISNLITRDTLQNFITSLTPMLMQIKSKYVSAAGRFKSLPSMTLKPTIGFTANEDKIREDWLASGGIRGISLFFVTLKHMEHRDISSNLWWITPGILNIMDDTTDLLRIRLKGAVLLDCFLGTTYDSTDTAQFDFSTTGLFDVYYGCLRSMWYLLPPSTNSKITEQVWKIVFPAMLSLFKAQFASEDLLYSNQINKFLSEILLQGTLPRVAPDHVELTIDLLRYIQVVLQILGLRSAVHMQRLIYTVGEFIIRNPFITLFVPLIHETVTTLSEMVKVCPEVRVAAHKYDLLGGVFILYLKCRSEGKLDTQTLHFLRDYTRLLQAAGCKLSPEDLEMIKERQLQDLIDC
ncbi:LAFE_0A00914g1_1 [Lachancea fermentati]|uniref:LAFE_0A00914g1_1 n=1 Tax=Lachancea fermentati TaxID=4955 RepID=A0A1G4M6M3_LACFM|nr:LAFE_0A00914g1_1 [Lachancea fermentati]